MRRKKRLLMNKRVLIIGAGASGCAAAIKLLDNQFTNVNILEAEHRIGGRIDTRPFAANVVDVGAQWCHGEINNVVFALGKEWGALSSNSARNDRIHLIKSNGRCVNQDDSEKLMDLMASLLDPIELKGKSTPLGQYIIQKYKSKLQNCEKFCDIDKELQNQFLDFYHKFQSSFDGFDDWHNVSCDSFTEYRDCVGDQLLNWRDSGYKTVFDLLEKSATTQVNLDSHILYGKCVVRMDYGCKSADGVPFVRVECADGSAHEADHVICTVSLGVLKAEHSTLFQPPLPAAKQTAIDAISIGACGKIFVEFKSCFWPRGKWQGFGLLWQSDDDLTKAIDVTNAKWLRGVFRILCVDFQENVLCVRIAGTEATEQMELAAGDEIVAAIRYLLQTFCSDWSVPDIVRIERSNWHSNPHFRGSYSYRKTGDCGSDGTLKAFVEPLWDTNGTRPLILFGGEATHEHYYSTVHGAIESGWREAERLIKFCKGDVMRMQNMKIKNPNGLTVKDGTSTQQVEPHRHVDVLILGAGLAGLGAATAINRANDAAQATRRKCSFLILEAQARAGGRVNTVELNEYTRKRRIIDNAIECNANRTYYEMNTVDGGAQWLHGKCNYLHELSEKYDLLSDEQSEEGLGAFLYENCIEIDPFLVKKIDFVIGEILGECEGFAHENGLENEHDRTYPKSVEHFMRDRFQQYLETVECPNERKMASDLFDWHIRFQIIDNSCLTLQDVSAKHWGKYSFNGESCQAHYNFRDGFGAIVNELIAELDGNCVLFRKEIVQVAVNGDDSRRPRISVKCADQSVYTANHVLVTFSLGVLKANYMKMFQPKLPTPVERAINSIGFETINKLFLQFETAWWGDLDGIQLIFKNDDSNNCHWTRHLTGFDILSPGAPKTLLGWVGGRGAVEMEQMSDKEIVEDCTKLLSKFTKIDVPTPIKCFCTRWHSNSFVRGAYSYISTDCDESDTILSSLNQALTLNDFVSTDSNTNGTSGDQSLPSNASNAAPAVMLFAGEACHEQYFSTAHGAFLSGMGQMQKILAFYN